MQAEDRRAEKASCVFELIGVSPGLRRWVRDAVRVREFGIVSLRRTARLDIRVLSQCILLARRSRWSDAAVRIARGWLEGRKEALSPVRSTEVENLDQFKESHLARVFR